MIFFLLLKLGCLSVCCVAMCVLFVCSSLSLLSLQSNLDDFLSTAELAGTQFAAGENIRGKGRRTREKKPDFVEGRRSSGYFHNLS